MVNLLPGGAGETRVIVPTGSADSVPRESAHREKEDAAGKPTGLGGLRAGRARVVPPGKLVRAGSGGARNVPGVGWRSRHLRQFQSRRRSAPKRAVGVLRLKLKMAPTCVAIRAISPEGARVGEGGPCS